MSDITTLYPRFAEVTIDGSKALVRVDHVAWVFAASGVTKTKIETSQAVFWIDEDYETVKRLMSPVYYLDTK